MMQAVGVRQIRFVFSLIMKTAVGVMPAFDAQDPLAVVTQ